MTQMAVYTLKILYWRFNICNKSVTSVMDNGMYFLLTRSMQK